MKILLILVLFTYIAFSLNNGLARTPQMAWNSWNAFHCSINESLIKSTIQKFVELGLPKYGYQFVNMDDCWAGFRKGDQIYPDPTSFPNGVKPLADYAHLLGIKFGLYTDLGNLTCAGRPGSLGFEKPDSETYASWGVDYVKVDNCYSDDISPKVRYPIMRDALNSTGRPIFYSMCEWGVDDPAEWAFNVGNSWRTTGDISPNWSSILSNINSNDEWSKYAAPGGWNDPDMLEVGNGGLTVNEQIAHFSLWCLTKAPLIIGTNLLNISQQTLSILTNEEAIAVNQDPLGFQGRRFNSGDYEVWAGPLSSNGYSIILLNKASSSSKITATWSKIGLNPNTKYTVRDLWKHQNIGVFSGDFTAEVESHAVFFGRLTPA